MMFRLLSSRLTNMRSLSVFLVTGLVVLLLVGCASDPDLDGAEEEPDADPGAEEEPDADPGAEEEPDADPADGFTVGLSWPDLSDPYFIGLRNHIQEAADEVEGLEIIHVNAELDPARQLDQIDELLGEDIDVLVVTAVESDSVVSGVRRAADAGVPAISLDRPISEAADEGLLLTHVGASAELAGYMQGRYVCEEIASDARMLGIWGPPGDETVRARIEGIQRAQEDDDCSDLELVAEDYARTNSPDDAANVMSDWLQVYSPGDIDAVVSYGDHLSSAALQILKAEGRDDIVVLGTANFGDFPDAICAGDPQAPVTVDFNLPGQGVDLVETVEEVRAGRSADLPEWVITEAVLVTEENCEDFPPG